MQRVLLERASGEMALRRPSRMKMMVILNFGAEANLRVCVIKFYCVCSNIVLLLFNTISAIDGSVILDVSKLGRF